MTIPCRAGVLPALALLAVGFSTPVIAGNPLIIERDYGGNVQEYRARARDIAGSGARVVIRGECQSACSLFLGLPGTCVEPDAVIKLHAATWMVTLPSAGMVRGETSPAATRQLMASYPRRLKDWIARHGGLTRNWLVLERQDLLAVLPSCGKAVPAMTANLARTGW